MPTTPTAAALVVKRSLPHAPDKVFRAFSDPAFMRRWFYSGKDWSCEADNEFRVGGSYFVNMRLPGGETVKHTGVYREIVPGKKLAFTWNSPYANDSLVTLSFEPKAGGTQLTLVHEFLAEDMRQPHQEGWGGCLDNLEALTAL